ncbi:hypothetical protein QBC45DRAFT_339290 [Copromyces sp. CBS 386.78]|nr:hypothetical protein QBC45DRAFT_339290 [Copromyces sp. CBS 386.78]
MGPNPTVRGDGGPTDPQVWDVADIPSEWYCPWGLQGLYKRGDEHVWRPKVGDREDREDTFDTGIQGQVRGRWLRDWDMLNHNHQSRSDSERHLRRNSMSIGGYSPVLSAYPPGRGHILCDPDWDMAEGAGSGCENRHPVVSSPEAQQTSSPYRFKQLPAEVWRMIVAYLVPVGCAYSFITLDYLLYPSGERTDVAGSRFCSLVQQMVPVELAARSSPGSSDTTTPAVRGFAHVAIANTNRFFQELVYERFFGGNTFIFHQSTSPILFSWTKSEDFSRWQSWSRIIARSEPDDEPGTAPFGLLGPLGPRAARYLREFHLVIASSPTESDDIEAMTKLANMVDSTVTLVLSEDHQANDKERQKLAISLHLHSSHPSPEYRDTGKSHPVRRCHQLAALQADVNQATGTMDIGLRSGHTVLRQVDWPWPSN